MKNTFTNEAEKNEYAGFNLTVEVHGEAVNLGSIFVTNKGATKTAKAIYKLAEAGELDVTQINSIKISGLFSSEDNSEELTGSSFA